MNGRSPGRRRRARCFSRAWAALLLLLVSCAEPPYVRPAKLPPCPRVIGSVYRPGEPSPAARAAGADRADVKEIVAAAGADRADGGAHAPSFPRTTYSATPKPPPATAPVASCGDKKNPCPLQRWMRETMATAVAANDAPKLAQALEKMAAFSPVPSWQWNAMATDAAAAARKGDVPAARKSCQGCHNAYKNPYKEKFRTLPVR